MKQYVKMINGQNPDLILIGGDLIDNSVIPLYAENMAEELTELKAPLGIYMVPGNHEYISGIDKSIQFMQILLYNYCATRLSHFPAAYN